MAIKTQVWGTPVQYHGTQPATLTETTPFGTPESIQSRRNLHAYPSETPHLVAPWRQTLSLTLILTHTFNSDPREARTAWADPC